MRTRALSLLQPAQITRSREWHDAARKARWLSWLSLAWMGAEGVIALTAGILAGSIALVSFGLDSFIEGFASLVLVWRFTGSRLLSHAAEERAQRAGGLGENFSGDLSAARWATAACHRTQQTGRHRWKCRSACSRTAGSRRSSRPWWRRPRRRS